LLAAFRTRFDQALLDEAIFCLARRTPELSAQTVVTRKQWAAFALIAWLLAVALIVSPAATMRLIMASLSIAFGVAEDERNLRNKVARASR
jgi:hypothetical protein